MSIGPERMLASRREAGIVRLLAQQGDHVAGVDPPIVAQHVADLALQQETVGEQLVGRHARQADVLDRVAERPVPQVVQQGRGHEQLGVFHRHGPREPLVVGQLLQQQQGQAIDPQRVLEPRVERRRIDQRDQAQLADFREAAELGRVDDLADAVGQRHVQLGGMRTSPRRASSPATSGISRIAVKRPLLSAKLPALSK